MSAQQEKPTLSTNADYHLEDDMMSESGSTVSAASSSRLPPRVAKLVAKLASLEEDMTRDDLSNEELVKIQGNAYDSSKTVFSSVHECLDRFEDILESYSQNINVNWCRLLPRMLSPDQRSWFIDHLKPHAALDWSFARKTLVNKYGIQDADHQAQFMQELFSLRMGRDDSVEQYTDWFYKLRREAGCEDNRVMAALFINSLLPELGQHVTLGQAHLSPDKRATIDHAANLARRMYVCSDSSVPTSAAAAGPSFAVSGKKNKGKKRADAKHCQLHGTGHHSSEECRALSSLQTSGNAGKVTKFSGSSSGARVASSSSAGSSSSGKKNCFKCGFVPWKQGHVCEVNHLAIRSASLLQSSSSSSASGSAPVTPPPPSSLPVPVQDNNSVASVHPNLAAPAAVPPANEDTLMSEVEESLVKACFNWT
ncbi:hypothetical protein INT45_013110 [Circinella minor]|uniref:Retrotransposon gag domain-containing protein n=1 Tax=Circinella minor TaxID=1195481 RepID=A0A8H7S4W4_9FUNG|nr:hypothetical protein INT45_013110 [Circinella minor]